MNRIQRCSPSSIIIAFGLSLCIIHCNSLKVNILIDYPRKPHTMRNRIFLPRTYDAITLNSTSGFEDEGEERRDQSFLQAATQQSIPKHNRGWNVCFSVVQTAVTAFCAGSLVAVLFSMVIFNLSLSSSEDQQFIPYFRRTRLLKTSSSVDFDNRNVRSNIGEEREIRQRSVKLYRNILNELDDSYVDDIEPTSLFEITIRAMLSSLDPYTEYISPQEILKRQQPIGIGAFVMKSGDSPEFLDGKALSTLMSNVPSQVALPTHLLRTSERQGMQISDGYHVVLSLEGYAYDEGLRIGDVIIGIDNQSIVDDTLETVRDLLKGPEGSKVEVTFRRPGIDRVQSIELERKQVKFSDVPYAGTLSTDSGIGYIKLQRFGRDAGNEMQQAIHLVQQRQIRGLILDLRDNSGGELFSAVQIASLFFPEGTFLKRLHFPKRNLSKQKFRFQTLRY